MRAALRIALKDLRQRVRDRSAFIWGFLAPVGLAFVFSLALSGVADGDAITVRFGVLDQDGGDLAVAFVDGVLGSQVEEDLIEEVRTYTAVPEAELAVESGDVDAVFVIPEGFSAAVLSGQQGTLEVVGYADSPIGTQVARAFADGFAGEINGVAAAMATTCEELGLDRASCFTPDLVAGAQAAALPLALTALETEDKQLDAGTFYSAGMAVMFLFLTVQFGVLGLLEEKSNGTMARLLAAPIPRWSIVTGKALTSFALGVCSMAAIVVATTLIPTLGADWGDPLAVAVLVLAGIAAAMGVMMMIAAFARTPEGAQTLQAIVAFLLAMLGGTFFPIGNVGGILGMLSRITPHFWFLRGLGDARSTGLAGVMGSVWPILVFAVLTAALASIRLRRVVEA